MTRQFILIGAWCLSTIILYVEWLGLELLWNLYDWQPTRNATALGVLAAIVFTLVLWHFLARLPLARFGRIVTLVCSLALTGLAIYVLPPEPLTNGLFARELSSPLWYRGARFLSLTTPFVLWLYNPPLLPRK